MSYIKFQDLHGAATLRGSERPWLLIQMHDLAAQLLANHPDAADAAGGLFDLLPTDHYLREVPPHLRTGPTRWLQGYARALQDIFDDPIVDFRGQTIRPLTLVLNTAMEDGSDTGRLAARLMGQCEINCWVDGPNRRWLADVVGTGLASGRYREGCGWEDLQRFLLERDDLPAVASYSSEFPTQWAAGFVPPGATAETDDGEEAWEVLTSQEQWSHGLSALRSRTAEQLEITPDWSTYRFGSEVTLRDLLAHDRTTRLEQAFQLTT
ncbi:hypothetical protein [Streptomyces sp. NBC_01264]|uniref:hypothetical protein n=1 Tax=Streptomyces sp. NBC_01264 TaxID=2903804 RepID=UPI002259A6C1|nr:hypothetical protein [Streptomyces sp. NBC_01264]MCX4784035.1 hypothetical protein [Streptomyces sp. NBC_01264]